VQTNKFQYLTVY